MVLFPLEFEDPWRFTAYRQKLKFRVTVGGIVERGMQKDRLRGLKDVEGTTTTKSYQI